MKSWIALLCLSLLLPLAGAELLHHQNLTDRNADGTAVGWQRAPLSADGGTIRLTTERPGSAVQYFRTAPQAGETLLVRGKIRKIKGANAGSLVIRDAEHHRLLTVRGPAAPGVWQEVGGILECTGKEAYFECLADYMGKDFAVEFKDLSVQTLPKAAAEQRLREINTEKLPPGLRAHGIAAPVGIACGVYAVTNAAGERLVLTFIADSSGCRQLLEINADTGKARSVSLPDAPVSVDLRPFYSLLSSRNRLYTSFGHRFYEYDVEQGKVTFSGKFSGYLTMGMTEDADGIIWLVSYPQCEVGSFDPATGTFTDYGSIRKRDWQQYQRYVERDDSGWLWFGVGTTEAQVVGFDPTSRRTVEVFPPDPRDRAATGQVVRASDGKVYGWNRNRSDTAWYELNGGKAVKLPGKPAFQPMEFSRKRDTQDAFLRDFPGGGRIESLDLADRVLRIRRPDGSVREVSFEYPSAGSYLMGVAAMPDGTIRGGSFHPMRYFVFDPAANSFTERGNARYQWNNILPVGNHLFIGAYGEGHLMDWDTARPYSGVARNGNPRDLGEATPAVHRPSMLAASPDGNTIVMAGTPGYGRTGGGLVIFNRKSGKMEVLPPEKLLTPESIHSVLFLSDRELLLGTTVGAGTGGRVEAKEASLAVYDLNQRAIVWREAPIPGVSAYLGLEKLPDGKVLAAVHRDRLLVFDPVARKVETIIPTGELGELVATQGPRILPNDGKRYFVLLRHGIAEFDPATRTLKRLVAMSREITAGGAVSGGRIWFCCNPELMSFEYR